MPELQKIMDEVKALDAVDQAQVRLTADGGTGTLLAPDLGSVRGSRCVGRWIRGKEPVPMSSDGAVASGWEAPSAFVAA